MGTQACGKFLLTCTTNSAPVIVLSQYLRIVLASSLENECSPENSTLIPIFESSGCTVCVSSLQSFAVCVRSKFPLMLLFKTDKKIYQSYNYKNCDG